MNTKGSEVNHQEHDPQVHKYYPPPEPQEHHQEHVSEPHHQEYHQEDPGAPVHPDDQNNLDHYKENVHEHYQYHHEKSHQGNDIKVEPINFQRFTDNMAPEHEPGPVGHPPEHEPPPPQDHPGSGTEPFYVDVEAPMEDLGGPPMESMPDVLGPPEEGGGSGEGGVFLHPTEGSPVAVTPCSKT